MLDEALDDVLERGETAQIEFKSEAKKALSESQIVEAVVCLTNGSGGELLLGVEDDATVSGARRRHGDRTDEVRLQALIANNTIPQIVTRVRVEEYHGRQIVRIEVPRSPTVVGMRNGLYVRRGLGADGRPACLPFLAHEMLADRIARGEVDLASIPEPSAELSDLDPEEFDRFRRLARNTAGRSADLARLSDEDILTALEVAEFRDGKPTLRRGALLLFGRSDSIRRFVPAHETVFQVLHRGVIRQNVIFSRALFRSAEELYELLRGQNDEQEVVVGLLRTTLDRIPDVVARELVANALVHRDYTVMGTTSVQISDDELTVTNPGGFPRGVTLDNFLELSSPRSRILASAFSHAGLVDRAGRGINRVFEAALRSGRPEPEYSRSSNQRVVVSVQLGGMDAPLVRFVLDHDARTARPFDLVDLQIVRTLKDDPRQSVADVSVVLQRPPAWTRSRLTRLVEDGLVEMRGDGRSRRFALSGVTYRALSTDAEYARVRAFDEPQQSEMIMNFVRAHGSVSRAEAAELCGTSPDDARRLLFRLRDAGRLTIRGDRRTARYFAT